MRQALAVLGIRRTVPLELPFSGAGRLGPLRGAVLLADSYELVEQLRIIRHGFPALPIVALVAEAALCQDVLDAGASSVVRTDAAVMEIARVVDSCLAGQPMISTGLAKEMIRLSGQPRPSDDESYLLSQLARGETVRSVAVSSGYSERHLYRRLSRLYQRLGVDTKEAAIEMARQRGWLQPPSPPAGRAARSDGSAGRGEPPRGEVRRRTPQEDAWSGNLPADPPRRADSLPVQRGWYPGGHGAGEEGVGSEASS